MIRLHTNAHDTTLGNENWTTRSPHRHPCPKPFTRRELRVLLPARAGRQAVRLARRSGMQRSQHPESRTVILDESQPPKRRAYERRSLNLRSKDAARSSPVGSTSASGPDSPAVGGPSTAGAMPTISHLYPMMPLACVVASDFRTNVDVADHCATLARSLETE